MLNGTRRPRHPEREGASIMIEATNIIPGAVRPERGQAVETVTSPADPTVPIGTYPLSDAQTAGAAVAAAAQARQAWRRTAGPERGNLLYRIAQDIDAQGEDLAQLASREMGKPIGETRGEAARAAAIFRYYAGEASRAIGDVIPSQQADTLQYSVRVPVGVVAAITPWNFPLAIPAWKVAPALAFGNTVVLKPAEWASLTGSALARIIAAALPPGVLTLVLGRGAQAGAALTAHSDVAAITFTGSSQSGRAVADAALAHGAKYQLEMGGKNAVIVHVDADLELAARLTVSGAMRSAGQKCTATSRAIVLSPVREAFTGILVRQLRELRWGDPLDPAAYLGPVVSRPQYDKVQDLIRTGNAEGARCLLGGPDDDPSHGYFVRPTLFDEVGPAMAIFQEEIFGPVLAISEASSLDDALRQANGVRYGLSASVFTRDLGVALRCVDELEVGLVRVNDETAGVELQAPFGGMKASSSHSREQGRAALEFFTETKTVAIRPPRG